MGMFVGMVAAVLLLACLLLSGVGCSRQSPSNLPATAAAGPAVATSAEGMKSLDRAAIRALLKRLADLPVPKEDFLSAMCYEMALPPRRADYVCPKCGERTLYDDSKLSNEEWIGKGLAQVVDREIPSCRRACLELRKVAGDAVVFDESQFCRKCSPKVTAPKLVLHVSYKGEKARDVADVTHGDLEALHDLLTGQLLTKDDKGFACPLKNCLPRLCVLLGVTNDE